MRGKQLIIGFPTQSQSSQIDDKISFDLPISSVSLRISLDVVAVDLLRILLFAVNSSSFATQDTINTIIDGFYNTSGLKRSR
jgi:hypothetical protein